MQTSRIECIIKNEFVISQPKHVVGTQKNHLKRCLNMFKRRSTLKKMLVCRAPTYPPKTHPTQKMLLPFFSLILLTNPSSKSLKAVF